MHTLFMLYLTTPLPSMSQPVKADDSQPSVSGTGSCKYCAKSHGAGSIGSISSCSGGGAGHGFHEQSIDNSVKVLEKIAGLYAERLLSDIVLE
ncbi:unnamed protein product, partial [Oppiella nova]